MSRRRDAVPRPLKRTEHEIVFITTEAQKGWTDCLAAAHNAMVEAWEILTREPEVRSPRLYSLKGELRYGVYQAEPSSGISTSSPMVAGCGISSSLRTREVEPQGVSCSSVA